MKIKLMIGWMIASVLVMSVAGVAVAAPVEQSGRPGAVIGRVISISGNTLEVQSRRGELVQVQTEAQTRFRVPGAPGATIDDLKVGDVIAALGRRTTDGLRARLVARLPANLRDQVAGQVTSIEDSTLIVEDKDGNTVNVLTTAITLFHSQDKPEASLADIKVGDLVIAVGVRQGDTLTAVRVGFKTPPERAPGPIALGVIQSISGGALTLKLPFAETLTVNTSANTFIVKRGQDGAVVISLSDLKAGDKIMVIGPRSGDNSAIDARVIVVGKGQ